MKIIKIRWLTHEDNKNKVYQNIKWFKGIFSDIEARCTNITKLISILGFQNRTRKLFQSLLFLLIVGMVIREKVQYRFQHFPSSCIQTTYMYQVDRTSGNFASCIHM